jgi:tryptophan synthase alpha chain
VSLKGVTGAGNIDTEEVGRKIAEIKTQIKIPVGVGFGIRDGMTAKLISNAADAVVIGSRIVQEIESAPPEKVVENVGKLVASFRFAMDA